MSDRGHQIITAAAMTGTATVTSLPFPIGRFAQSSMQERHTGTAVGNFALECSINFDKTANTGDWFTVSMDDPISDAAGAAGGQGVDLTDLPYPWARLKYTNISGTGVLDAWVYGKGISP